MQRSYKGFFITLEGGEGSGKTGHIPNLVEHLHGKGLTVFPSREPGGTPISEQIRDILKDLKNYDMHPRTETLLFQAARAQIVERVVIPRLNKGEIFISDRYLDSTVAYQGYGHEQDLEQIKSLIKYATGGLTPDLTVLLKVDPEVGLARRGKSEEWNRLDAYKLAFHNRVEKGYDMLVREEPDRWLVVDANQSIEKVYGDLVQVVEGRLVKVGLLEGNNYNKERR